jgi:ornithine cyclodeaminase
LIRDDHIVGELGDLLLERFVRRRSGDELTLFRSLGIAIEDLAAAHYIHEQTIATGTGVSVSFGA